MLKLNLLTADQKPTQINYNIGLAHGQSICMNSLGLYQSMVFGYTNGNTVQSKLIQRISIEKTVSCIYIYKNPKVCNNYLMPQNALGLDTILVLVVVNV